MNKNDDDIESILGTKDPVVVEFVLRIAQESQDLNEFEKKFEALRVVLETDKIQRLYATLTSTVKDDPISSISKVLDSELGISDNVVAEFILQIVKDSPNISTLLKKLTEMNTGVPPIVAKKLFDSYNASQGQLTVKTKVRIKNEVDGLELPNETIKWEDIYDSKDLLSMNFITEDEQPVLGKIYKGIIKKIMPFGCFVQILHLKKECGEGLVHISELCKNKVRHPSDVVKQGQTVYVKISKIMTNGKISLSMINIDQVSGKEKESTDVDVESLKVRGRPGEKQSNPIRKRKLTSPERWELRQLIASGMASIKDYPELLKYDQKEVVDHEGNNDKTEDQSDNINEIEEIDIERNPNDRPKFLRKEGKKVSKKYELPKLSNNPMGSLNRAGSQGSKLMLQHREEKLQKKKDIEEQIKQKRKIEDPTKDPLQIKKEIDDLRQQLTVTSWEKKKSREKVSYGKKSAKPISAQRKSLPVYSMREKLMSEIKNNQFLVIVGETGSGKTTQITQYLDDEGFSKNGIIGCTQPRRVAAESVARRVAEEVGCKIGREVGYTIRFENVTSDVTRIKYMTDGMLQQEALLDPILSKYSVIMLDEAHERTIATDVLFALLKKAAMKRDDLKVIVTSATLDSNKFAEYFNNCPIINIPGKTFPVEVLYSKTPTMDYIASSLDCVMDIHTSEGPGDILVFLTGQEEIDTCCEVLFERAKEMGDKIDPLIILPVYSALPSEIQSKIFEPTPRGSRKVIFATNIAETSITIDGIFYVVDPGFSKVNTYSPRAGMEQLVVAPISQAQANQRKGRAGRTGPGKCYRLYTESSYQNEMLPNAIPEIQRQNLLHTILMLKAMGINDLLHFDFMDPPPKSLMVHALEELYHLQALDADGHLTKLGQRMSLFPMEPTLARALLSSVSNNCSDEMITIIAMLSVQNVFYRPKNKQQEADGKKARFHHPYGDHLTLLNVYNRWERSNCSEDFCNTNFLHFRHLRRAKDVKRQISMIFERLNLPITSCNENPEIIRKTLVSGFFLNAAKRETKSGYKTINGGTEVGIHPSSALYGREYEYVIYHSLILTTREFMSQISGIEPQWLLEVAPHFYKVADENSQSRKKTKIEPLFNRHSKDQNSWRLSSKKQNREKALGMKKK
ncbi:hypothetical protein B1J92_H09526g [Nakaseomyces glabratus]|nr:hypothetical protein B1J91_H09526g [Nakaseomyces glabratus]OXB48385.1 hypothetical protein B1J92_H09526g [Nakaseomyces glabratus]